MILSKNQIKAAEHSAVNSGAFSFSSLMYNAGTLAAREIKSSFNIVGSKITVICGKGNNGGDGIVAAAALSNFGADVSLYFPLGMPNTEIASKYLPLAEKLKILSFVPEKCDILIDALFGIGFSGEIEGNVADTVTAMNFCEAKKIAIDIPSGVDADALSSSKICFKADLTITFIALKPCFIMPETSSFCGEYKVIDIGVKTSDYTYLTVKEPIFKKRPINSHKGTFGTALLLAGSYGLCGAEILAAKAAVAGGAGLVKAFVGDKNYTAFTVSVPEAVCIPVNTSILGSPIITPELLETELLKSSALLLGCGLGDNRETLALVKSAINNSDIPMVIDADGINAIARDISMLHKAKAPIILTPHPKEMARLLHTSVENIQKNRPMLALKFAREYNCIVVLKGANTIIAAPDSRVFVNLTGNAGLATAGSGDVLAGLITAFLAMGEQSLNAALKAVYLHGRAGDNAVKRINEYSLTPSDIIEEIRIGKLLP